uniref:(California timema) hypothetical protein n=1 Tax=Timema californicum TaxID=61474 RepID=A0A7R9JA23_TIMCA|nr:unnamed protein product [Timema californicum]
MVLLWRNLQDRSIVQYVKVQLNKRPRADGASQDECRPRAAEHISDIKGVQPLSFTLQVNRLLLSFILQPSLKPLAPSHVGGMTFYQLEEFVDLSLRMMIEEAAVFDNQVKEVNRRDMVIRNNALQVG